MFTAYGKYFTFSGRASRPEFWWFQLWVAILFVAALALDPPEKSISDINDSGGAVYDLVVLLHLFPLLAVSVRRLHDINKSGWYSLLGLIPLVGLVVLLVWHAKRGSDGDNRFGSAPSTTNSLARSGLDRLEQLGRLRDQGVLTPEEFSTHKAAILK